MVQDVKAQSRRKFLQFLAASPLCGAYAGLNSAHAAAEIAASPADAIDIFDLELTASGKIPVAHWGYLATGVNDDSTLRANRIAFEKYLVRSRRLMDVADVDSSIELLGTRWSTPIVLAPVGSQKAFHPDGELGSARAAKSRNHLQMLSTVSSTSIEEVTAAREAPVWFQLYTSGGWQGIRARLRRAEASGSPAVVLNGGQSARRRQTHACARGSERSS